ncbi:NAD(P)-binding protein [Aspergillus sclerotioniger CBS 115572]|uniref:NAD(P)-binding protein n=1 Tax=Aspergillus sclerotioniger CBS 115572 TaxID=1450535 RepID=A0A317XB55_9EURO|nr:NAD(P)-binding protein [Aspergillus sclerotioniger CBS 115572]PWY94188.1 NAD(P)-binding protein [Aspergillus sclerotioniger CBS 115572]
MAEVKLVLITGANQGIGFETAKNLILSDNYHVIIGSRDPFKGEEAAQTLQAIPGIKGSVSSIQIDVTDDKSVDDAAAQIKSQYGRLDILVNNAALNSMVEPPTRETLRKILDVNVVGALSTTEAFLDLLRKSSEKRLVFVSSSTGSISQAADPKSPFHQSGAAEYRTSKAALNMMMVLYLCRLEGEGFKVFGADPGLCATNLTGDPESLRRRNAAEPSDGGERVATVVKGERDADVGRVLGVYGVSPF